MSLRPMDSEFKRRMSPSLSLVTIASLTPKAHFVYIEDENLQPLNFEDQPDLVGVAVNVDTAYRAFEISAIYRARGIPVIFGGIHASSDPDHVAPFCDSVCIGEAEDIWSLILEDVMNNCLKKKYSKMGNTDLNFYPLPDWNFTSKKDYLYHNIVITSRGCPFKCDFCYNSCEYVHNPYRNRPVENVLDEIRKQKMKQVLFIDDNLIGNKNWVIEFLTELKKLKVIWHGAVSTNLVHFPELIELMAESGCRSLFIGFESINSQSVQSVGKSQNKIREYEKLISELHYRGIMINASLVFGFDYDTEKTFPETLKWLINNKIETMTAHILTPYPGTVLYKKLLSENRIIDFDLGKYNTSNVVFRPERISPHELRSGYLWMYEQFYSMKNIIKRKPEHMRLIIPYFLFNLGYRKFGRFTSFIANKLGMMNQVSMIARKLSYGIG